MEDKASLDCLEPVTSCCDVCQSKEAVILGAPHVPDCKASSEGAAEQDAQPDVELSWQQLPVPNLGSPDGRKEMFEVNNWRTAGKAALPRFPPHERLEIHSSSRVKEHRLLSLMPHCKP